MAVQSSTKGKQVSLHDGLCEPIQLLKKRRSKIIATVGPASSDATMIRALLAAGVNVFRLNMSHGEHASHAKNFRCIRETAADMQLSIAILADLCGPKIRTGSFEGGCIQLFAGSEVTITMRDVLGHTGLIPSQYASLVNDVTAGQRIFLADGEMELRVHQIEGIEVHCFIIQGGILGDHQGINLPDAKVSAPSMTSKDYRDAEFTAELGVDLLALSFVRKVEDITELRSWLNARGSKIGIVAKIERPEAVQDAEAIVLAADAIMVARGDLGVELPPEQVPIAQQMLIDVARLHRKPVIVATQILESMIVHARPTRAETTDIFHSVSSSTDALMLSAETATGLHPLLALETMDRVIRYAEAYLWKNSAFGSAVLEKSTQDVLPLHEAIARSTAMLSRDLMVRGIVVLSRSGVSAAAVSSGRPEAPILAVSSDAAACRRMNLLWGVIPVLSSEDEMADMASLSMRLTQMYALAEKGDTILLVQGFHADRDKNRPSVTVLEM